MSKKYIVLFILVMIGVFYPVSARAAFDVFQGAGSYYPDIVYDAHNNRYLAVYVKYDAVHLTDSDIYAQFVKPDGSTLGAPIAISTSDDITEKNLPAVTYDTANRRFLVVWQDDRNDPGATFDIYGQLVNADGTMHGGNFAVSAVAGRHEGNPALAYGTASERFFVVWEDERDTEELPLIYGQLINADGTLFSSAFRTDSFVPSGPVAQQFPKVSYDTVNHRFFLVWNDDRNAISISVFGQIISADGTLSGESVLISGGGATDEWMPSLAFDSVNLRFLVAWYDFRTPCAEIFGFCANADIYAQFVGANGTLTGTDFLISSGSGEYPLYNPSVVYNGASQRFLVAWYGHVEDSDIYGNLVFPNGTPTVGDTAISTAAGSQYLPRVAANSRCGNFLVAYYIQGGMDASVSYSPVGPPCGPEIAATPMIKSFGAVGAGNSSAAQTFTISESGGGTLEIGAVTTAGSDAALFTIQNDTCSNQTITPFLTCTLEVSFSPLSSGGKSALLRIPSNAADTPTLNILLSGTGVVPLSLKAPRSLTAIAISSSSIEVAWDDRASSELGYRLQRKTGACTSSSSWSEIATPGVDETTHTDSGLTSNTAYSYRIRAYNGSAQSAYSNCASARTGRAASPASPTGLYAISLASSTVALNWTDASADETSFRIYRKAGLNPWKLIATLPVESETYIATANGNTSTTAYSFYVEACNSSGCSPRSTAVKVPFAPANLRATASTSRIDLLWRDRSLNETAFALFRKDGSCADAGTWELLSMPPPNTTSYSDTDLVATNSYSYKVSATIVSAASPHAYGYSSASNCVEATVP